MMNTRYKHIYAAPTFVFVGVMIALTVTASLYFRVQTDGASIEWTTSHRLMGRSIHKLESYRHEVVQTEQPDFADIDIFLEVIRAQQKILTELQAEGERNFARLKIDASQAIESASNYDHVLTEFKQQLWLAKSSYLALTNSLEEASEQESLLPGSDENRIEQTFLNSNRILVLELDRFGEKFIAEYDPDLAAERLNRAHVDYLESGGSKNAFLYEDTSEFLSILDEFKDITQRITEAELALEIETVHLIEGIEEAQIAAESKINFIYTAAVLQLLALAGLFIYKSAKLKRELVLHNQELENQVAERTQSLEAALRGLRDSMEKQKEIEEELRLAHRLEALGQLAAGIAHEINTPSQFVNDNLQFLLEAHKDLARVRAAYAKALESIDAQSEHRDLIEEIQSLEDSIDLAFLDEEVPSALNNSLDGMERISKIVKSMKDFSHPGSDGRDLVDINQAIETTLSVTRNEWKYVAAIEKNLDARLPKAPVVASELNQVLLNIIVNAAQAIGMLNQETRSDSLGTIAIETLHDDEFVSIRIRDSGCGIPQENIDRVFDPFFTTKEVGKGTGQGLSIARKIIVDNHGGQLKLRSEVGEFTEFFIQLPREL